MNNSTLLICTLGGSPEPVVAALKHWRPARVCFVHTPQTIADVEARVVPMARTEGVNLDAGRYDLFELPDGQNLETCLDYIRQLTTKAEKWAARGESFQVVVDFTGGTKCMSAAICIQASRWTCEFSYVGGSERSKDGVGVVVSGMEKIVHQANPWNSLGHQAVEEYVVLFDQHDFQAAARVAGRMKQRVSRPDRKNELACLENLAKALQAWDLFDHKKCKSLLNHVNNSANNLRAVLGKKTGDCILAGVAKLAAHLEQLIQAQPPSHYHVFDLLANAKRRADEGRYDDAVARLYRAIEAIAQVELKEKYGIENTEKVPLEKVPEPLHSRWVSRAVEGVVTLGLQHSYELLEALENEAPENEAPENTTSEKFRAAGLGGTGSPLVARNRSVLAHGFERVSNRVFENLWCAAVSLAEVNDEYLPSFPSLAKCRS